MDLTAPNLSPITVGATIALDLGSKLYCQSFGLKIRIL